MTLTQFGPFAVVLEKGELTVPGYLELLHLHQPGAQIVIDRVERALSAGDPARWVAALFRDANWRPGDPQPRALGGRSSARRPRRTAPQGRRVEPLGRDRRFLDEQRAESVS
ncbi:hypothetical protein [Sorangium sp. So ce854]|uniref:hypothetical protein n=1 Tax=Sorangium sp. So ce854 TaxID=3133322 RepID=UPI003F607D14